MHDVTAMITNQRDILRDNLGHVHKLGFVVVRPQDYLIAQVVYKP